MRRCAVAKCIVHSREFRFHIFFAQSNQLERFYHDLRIVVTHRTGRQLNSVADQIVLICQNLQRILILQRFYAALGHGERIVAKFQFAGLFADFVHREINNPTELIAFFFHIAIEGCANHLANNTCSLLCCAQGTCTQCYKVTIL